MCGSRKQNPKGFFKVCIFKNKLSFLRLCIDETTLTDDTKECLISSTKNHMESLKILLASK